MSAVKRKKLLSSDPKLRKKQLRDAALREAAAKKAKEAKVTAVPEPVTATSGEVVSKASGEAVKNTTIMGKADVKEAEEIEDFYYVPYEGIGKRNRKMR